MNSKVKIENAPLFKSQDFFRLLNGIAIVVILYIYASTEMSFASKMTLCIGILLYMLIINLIPRFCPVSMREKITESLCCLDTFLIGAFVGAIKFALLPTIAVVIFTLYHNLQISGWRSTLLRLVIFTAGAASFFYLAIDVYYTDPDNNATIILLVALGLYLVVSGKHVHSHRNKQESLLTELKQQMIQLKLRSYKLSKYLSPTLRKAILSGKEVKLETHRKKLTIFFSDIVGFSELAEEMETEALTALLNNYLTEMSDIAIKFGGTVDKFIGDGIMIFYGDPSSRGPKTDCVACVAMAIAMKKHMKALQLKWANQGIQKPLEIRMGINTGYCTVGNFGTENRLDYTVLGTEVNLASRLESSAKNGEILISHETYSLVKDLIVCEDKGEISVKGYPQPVRVYSAVDMRKNLGKNQAYFEEATDGFSVYMDVEKINNYDRERILKTLKSAAKRLEVEKTGIKS